MGRICKFKSVSSRIVWHTLNTHCAKVVILSACVPGMKRRKSKTDLFWECLSGCLGGFSDNEW